MRARVVRGSHARRGDVHRPTVDAIPSARALMLTLLEGFGMLRWWWHLHPVHRLARAARLHRLGRHLEGRRRQIGRLTRANQILHQRQIGVELAAIQNRKHLFAESHPPPRRHVRRSRQAQTLQVAVDALLDQPELPSLAGCHQRDRLAATPGAPRAADTVDVGFGVEWQVIVDDVAHIGDIQPARRHIRRHQHLCAPGAETFERALALRLGDLAVDRLRQIAQAVQLLRDHIGVAACIHEDDCRLRCLQVQDTRERLRFRLIGHLVVDLAHPWRHRLTRRDTHPYRVVQILLGEPGDAGRNRRGEERALMLARQRAEDRSRCLR